MNSPMQSLTIFSLQKSTLSPGEYELFFISGGWCLSSCLSLDCAWASAMISRAVRAAWALSAKVAHGTLGPRKERSEGHSPKANAEGATRLGPIVSLQAATAKLSINYFFNLGWYVRGFPNGRLIGSWYLSPMPNSLWCCVPDCWYSTSWIPQISTKVSQNCEPSSKTKALCTQYKQLPTMWVLFPKQILLSACQQIVLHWNVWRHIPCIVRGSFDIQCSSKCLGHPGTTCSRYFC